MVAYLHRGHHITIDRMLAPAWVHFRPALPGAAGRCGNRRPPSATWSPPTYFIATTAVVPAAQRLMHGYMLGFS